MGSSMHGGTSAGVGALEAKPNDYVYFERRPAMFGDDVMQKATAAKMRLELYYKEAVEGVVARKERWVFISLPGRLPIHGK